MITKNNTFNLVYAREYEDSEERYDPYFFIYNTIFRNIPLKYLSRINDVKFKEKVKAFCDKNFTETASNYTGVSTVDIIVGDEYYRTYADEFGEDVKVRNEDSLLNDYGQLVNGRQFFKYDFAPKLTDNYTYKNLNSNMKGLQNG